MFNLIMPGLTVVKWTTINFHNFKFINIVCTVLAMNNNFNHIFWYKMFISIYVTAFNRMMCSKNTVLYITVLLNEYNYIKSQKRYI